VAQRVSKRRSCAYNCAMDIEETGDRDLSDGLLYVPQLLVLLLLFFFFTSCLLPTLSHCSPLGFLEGRGEGSSLEIG
jgi:hypothetical protein